MVTKLLWSLHSHGEREMAINNKFDGSDKCYEKEKNRWDKDYEGWVGGRAKGGLSEEMMLEQRLEGSKEM